MVIRLTIYLAKKAITSLKMDPNRMVPALPKPVSPPPPRMPPSPYSQRLSLGELNTIINTYWTWLA
jgi:hypothetical protein